MDITGIIKGLKEKNQEGVEFVYENLKYIWLTNDLGQYSLSIYDNSGKEQILCIIREFGERFYLEKSLILGKVVNYGSKGKVVESTRDRKFIFKSFEDGEFLDILTNPTIIIDENSPIGIVEFDGSGKPIEQDILSSNFIKMKEISTDIVSHFIKTSDGYEFGLTSQIDHFASALVSLS